ncbi:unnamed protein product [Clonostachys chloroleuca]|uniref:Phytase A n=1 Tax=Clonostachys chloroleuca TaxID=1926264 RepID=A0AA35QA94_9HYPO|nr:unnamed protein product [Clonostachys chloroleuca]
MASDIMARIRWLFSRLVKSTYRYTPVPDDEAPQFRPHLVKERRKKAGYFCFGIALLLLILYVAIPYGDLAKSLPGCERHGKCKPNPHRWGQYSPFFSVPSDIDGSIPAGCEVTLALVLSRHGSRNPTSPKSALYKDLIEHIQSSVSHYGEGFEFLADYAYTLGNDELTIYGEQQMVDSGAAFYKRYRKLADDIDPFIRAAGSSRVIASAKNFTHGLYATRGNGGSHAEEDILIIPETDSFNNSINHGSCSRFEDGPYSDLKHEKQAAWKERWLPSITKRLNQKLPGANLSLTETVYFMDLCPFHSVADKNAKPSQFCSLFSEDEWRGYDYYESLDKWYGYGFGNPLGPTQGVGYVNEVIARLTGEPVKDHTSTNSTLDSSPETFPLDRKLYADFSHDNTMISIYAALGLYEGVPDLSVEHRVPAHQAGGFSAAWVVPFAARMYLEKMQCGSDEKEYVRILINDRVVTPKCKADSHGRCELDLFIDSLSFAKSGGKWETCEV